MAEETVPGEMTRLLHFMADCMSVGALRGFKHFSVYIRSREEIVLRVFRDPDNPPKSQLVPVCSSTIHESLGRVHASDETKQTIARAQGQMEMPFDISDQGLAEDTEGINFLIAGYQRYRCPYVWLRTYREGLVIEDGKGIDKDAPIELGMLQRWSELDVRPWDVICEIIYNLFWLKIENPFAIDHEYFERVTIEERLVATGAMLLFLRRVYLRRYHCSDILLNDIRHLQRVHFHCLNAMREYQNVEIRDAGAS